MKKFKQLLRQWRIAFGKRLLDQTKPTGALDQTSLKRVLFLRQDGKIGDYIVSSFVFRELKKYNPNLEIGVVCSDDSLFIKNPHIDHIYRVKKKNIIDYLKTGLKLRKVRYDVLIDPTIFLRNRDLMLIRLINARVNIGYLKAEYGIFNVNIADPQLHFSAVYYNALRLLGIENIDDRYDIPQDPISTQNIADFIVRNQLAPIIALNCFGAASARRFSTENIIRLLDYLAPLCANKTIVLLTYPQVTAQLTKIADKYDNVVVYADTRTIFDSIALIQQAETVISPDTSIIHIASGFSKNVIAFYQDKQQDPVNFTHWYPNNHGQTHILFYQHNLNEIPPEAIQADWLNIQEGSVSA
ncbi:ADP-heptose:LPS heptosyltransferase [Pasteurella testudinis DSM 23072]|uniref:ADP-heptose:LPS heptosyltransferase n=1 Tax=Pasteurella testudinis DSM 23072 TaxID=1122938 RepID=A0A1W1VAY3_9PAST|nr:glycosyltransferase family 9 protein [Pasteurella testudinis]SMB90518.1 ADP-heptose:LPS heptosyltransferase [Pasteurella testudinis DSM 23072]SUB52813.1 glycosyl transferase, family 9 protein [Pasteurella testudinis]